GVHAVLTLAVNSMASLVEPGSGGFWAGPGSPDQILTTVQRQGAACDISGTLAGQPRDHVGDFLAFSEPSDRDLGDDPGQDLLVHGADHLGVDVAGGDAVDGHALAGVLQRQRLGEADHPGLGGGIVGLADLALLAVDRADVDDAPPAAVAHAVDHLPGHVEHAVHVHPDHVGPLVGGHLVEEAVAGDAGVVDQHIHRPQRSLDLGHGALAVLERADVALDHHHAQLLGRGAGGGLVAGVAGGDRQAVLLKPLDDGLADAAGAAGHECDACHVRIPVPPAAS